MPNSRLRRSVLLLAALVLCGLSTAAGVAQAAPARATGSAAVADDSGSPGKLMLVLDSSGSMKEPAAGGETKIGAAKKALNTVIGKLPADQPVGLRVFGAKVFSAKDPGACTDSQLKVPVATGNRGDLRSAVASYKPYGETPIGYALQQTGKDLGSTGKRSIVLVSDGVPTCAPNPCVVAKKLASQGVDLHIDVVGLDVNSRARSDLECIAHAGHGVYYDVDNSKDFAESLVKVTTRAARPYTAIGKEVSGTSSAADAPVISNGDWLDRTNGQKDRFYRIKRTLDSSTVHFSAAFRDPNNSVFNRVDLSTSSGQECQASGSVDVLSSNTLVSSAATAGPLDPFGKIDQASACATAKELVAHVSYSGDSTDVPIEMRVTELPKASNLEQLPPRLDTLSWVEPASGTPTATQGGTSFDDAPLLQPGSYRDNIVQGETLTYQVKVDWGQQLSARVAYPRLSEARAKAIKDNPISAVSVFAPTRARAGSAPNGQQDQAAMFNTGVKLGTVSGPVRFRNTGASYDGISGADDAGVYTVTVFLAKKPGGASIPVPFLLNLGVSGSVSGAPAFVSAPVSPESSSPSPSAHSSGKADSGSSSDSGSGGGGFPVGPVLGGLGVLAILAAVVVAVRARASSA